MDSAPYDRKVENPSFFYGLLRVIDGFPTVKRRVPKTGVATVDYRCMGFYGQTTGSLRVNYGFTYGAYVFSIAFCKFLQFSFCGHKVKETSNIQSNLLYGCPHLLVYFEISFNFQKTFQEYHPPGQTASRQKISILQQCANAVRTKVIEHNHQISKLQAPQRSDSEPGTL